MRTSNVQRPTSNVEGEVASSIRQTSTLDVGRWTLDVRIFTRPYVLIVSWTIAFIIALLLDARVAEFARASGLARAIEGSRTADVIKIPGNFWFTLAVAALLWLFRRSGWKCSVFVILTGVVSGANALLKWIVGRTRPFKLPGTHNLRPFELHPFWHGISGLFNQRDLSFPSGHECTAAALAAAIVVVWPRGAWFFIALAVLVGIERVAENAHYFSDVVAAAGFSMLCVALLNRALSKWIKTPRQQGFLAVVPPISVESGTLEP
jgi:membrane-associated phospholipid phosphatase